MLVCGLAGLLDPSDPVAPLPDTFCWFKRSVLRNLARLFWNQTWGRKVPSKIDWNQNIWCKWIPIFLLTDICWEMTYDFINVSHVVACPAIAGGLLFSAFLKDDLALIALKKSVFLLWQQSSAQRAGCVFKSLMSLLLPRSPLTLPYLPISLFLSANQYITVRLPSRGWTLQKVTFEGTLLLWPS